MSIPSTSSISPPTPAYIFRHHEHPIHALHFFAKNTLLASGDSSGLLILWRLTTRRPVIVFKAHDGGIMGIKDWADDRLITHGRDHKLRVWDIKLQLVDNSEGTNSRRAAIQNGSLSSNGDDAKDKKEEVEERKPWLLHSMAMNALNFCAFATCDVPTAERETSIEQLDDKVGDLNKPETTEEISLSLQPVLFASPNGLDSGGIDIFHLPSERRISQIKSAKDSKAGMVMTLVLNFDQQAGRFFIVAGFEDGSVVVNLQSGSVLTSMTTVTTLKWTWEQLVTCRVHGQPVLSLDVTPDLQTFITSSADALLARFEVPLAVELVGKYEPEKSRNTKHAGQQDLKIRSDGRIFATAGWDGNVRVYSVKTLKELAVLQWHKEGCYAVAFAEVLGDSSGDHVDAERRGNDGQALVEMSRIDKMKYERDRKVHNTHWLVAGSKDGKISLWNIY